MCLAFGLKYMTIHYEMLRIYNTLAYTGMRKGGVHTAYKTILLYFDPKKNRREIIFSSSSKHFRFHSIYVDWHERDLNITRYSQL